MTSSSKKLNIILDLNKRHKLMAETLYKPEYGVLTFEAEGNNDPKSKHYSRRAHVPTSSSGVTIGRGYDMKYRSKKEIINDLSLAGVPHVDYELLANGSKLTGDEAKSFVKKDEIKKIEITEEAQKKLFEITYSKYYQNAKRICKKSDVVKKYGACNWSKMDTKIKEVVTDLLYRGDYNPTTRKIIQPAIVSGNIDEIKKSLDKIKNVPMDRKMRRKSHLK